MDSKHNADGNRVLKDEKLTPDAIKFFQNIIYDHYEKNARIFPWRMTSTPYHIAVSEIMLQQTQTYRVEDKYKEFVTLLPDFYSLAYAPLKTVLKLWQGLGYNRRAIALKKIAQIIVNEFGGNLPSSVELLMTLPGIGQATASAIAAFAFNEASVFIETNIRTVFIHFFFYDRDSVRDKELLPVVEKTLDISDPRNWYYALMDYGAALKKEHQFLGRKSAHYRKQNLYKGSNRQIRGMILKALIDKPGSSSQEIIEKLMLEPERIMTILQDLQKEGFIKSRGKRFSIA